MFEKFCKKYFIFNWEKIWIIIVSAFLSILLHNLIYAIFNIEEAFFLTIVVIIIPSYFIISGICSLIFLIKSKRGKNAKDEKRLK